MPPRTHRITVHEGYAIWATLYDEERNPLIMTEEPRCRALLEQLPQPRRALDVGTGTGRWALYLAKRGSAVTAIDESPDMLAVARAKADAGALSICFEHLDLQDGLPFPAGHFDLVVCALTLCHLPNLQGAVAECSRVLRPGGYLLITDFHPQALANGWETTVHRGEDVYYLSTARHSVPAYLHAVEESNCDVLHVEEVLVRDQPEEANVHGANLEEFMSTYGDWPLCLIILARRRE